MSVEVVNAGDFKVSRNPNTVLTTLLGSCVAVCVRNIRTGVGGMNHFLLPQDVVGLRGSSRSLIYGTYSIERLINAVIDSHWGRKYLEVKVFGGARMLAENLNVGDVNSDFVEKYFETEGIAITASDLRGERARKVNFEPHSGKVMVAKLTKLPAFQISESEKRAREALRSNLPTGSFEIL